MSNRRATVVRSQHTAEISRYGKRCPIYETNSFRPSCQCDNRGEQ